ncbi:MAG: 2-hydroxyacid dehydrogenase [Eubacteriales bacterium]|nr:2-hydroxyacid dehydrogenase [Eubacteriales bacterium]
MNIVLLEPLAVKAEKIEELAGKLKAKGHEFTAYDTLAASEAEQVERAKDADVLIIANHPLSDNVIRQCSKLKFISVAFVGIDHVGVTACREKGIHISNAAGYCDDAVAELALGLALDCLRNITRCDSVTRKGGTKAGLVGHELKGRTVGIIGTGHTGKRVAELYKAFGCKVLGYSRSGKMDESIFTPASLEDLLAGSDIVSIHVPLTDATKGMISRERIALMKQGAMVINTARGPVVDSAALAEALNEGKLAAVGSDVFEMEPPVPTDHPLVNAERTVLTPHVAFATIESLDRRAEIVFDNVLEWMGGRIQNQML